jgi:hypothetical protein
MESLDEMKNKSSKPGFFKHVFNFDNDSKEEMLNIVQYSILALIPIIILNKAMQRFVPEADEDKGNVEILAEIVLQVIVMFLGILIIHRIITYIPTYSGSKYTEFSVTNIILAVLLIVLSLQTKLGEKVSILVDRVLELWEGPKNEKGKNNKNGKPGIKVSQPISQNTNQMAMNQSLNSQTTSLSQLPPPQLMSSQGSTDYNNMFQGKQNQSNGMNSNSPPTNLFEGFEPMAANEAFGGGAFGGANW